LVKVLIVYDSTYGCTERIAQTIGRALDPTQQVSTVRASDAKPEHMVGVKLLIVGSPTQGGRPTQAVQEFLKAIPEEGLLGVAVAAFDTRVPARWVGIFGYAAENIFDTLKKKSGIPVMPPEGFFVTGKEGPLKEGESERAALWAEMLMTAMARSGRPRANG